MDNHQDHQCFCCILQMPGWSLEEANGWLCDGFWIWALYDYQWLSQACLRLLFLAYRRPILVQGCYWGNPWQTQCFWLMFASLFQISISSSINGSRLCTCIACGHVCHVLWEQMEPNICMHTCVIYLNIYLFTYLYFIFSTHYILHIYKHKYIYIYTYYVQFCGIPSDSCRIFSSSTSRSKRPGTVANLIPGFAHEDLWPNPNALAPSGGCPLSLSLYVYAYIYIYTVQACNLV